MGAIRYTLNGQSVGVSALAKLAGCSERAMGQRLVKIGMTPEQAVAAGAKLPKRGGALRYELEGRPVTVAELAQLAGCTKPAMQERLTKSGLTPEQAIAAGAKLPARGRRSEPLRIAGVVVETKGRGQGIRVKELQFMGAKLDRQAEVITPADVKRTVAPPIPERFSTAGAVPLFSGLGPGRYLAGDTHMAKVYGGRKP